MRILLINPKVPPAYRIFEYADEETRKEILRRVRVGPPLGLCDIAGMLPEEDIRILDQKAEADSDPNYDIIQGALDEVKEFGPDIIGFTCNTAQFNSLKKAARVIKEQNPNVLIIAGGIHPTACPDHFIGTDVDIVVRGYGKTVFYMIVQEIKKNHKAPDFSKIPGLGILKDGTIKYTASLSELSYDEFRRVHYNDAYPNRKLVEKYSYILPANNEKITFLRTSFGCTSKCNFCSIWQLSNGRYFWRDVDSVINELKTLEDYLVIRFSDSHTFGNLEHAKKLFTRIKEENLHNHIYFADSRADAVISRPDVFKVARDAGLKIIIMGLETANNDEFDIYEKKTNTSESSEALKILNGMGFFVSGNYIIRPDYTERDFARVAKFVQKNPILFSTFTVLTPFPGTKQYEMLKDQIVIEDLDFYNLTNAVTKTRLPEKKFYGHIRELYRIAGRSRMKWMKKYKVEVPEAFKGIR